MERKKTSNEDDTMAIRFLPGALLEIDHRWEICKFPCQLDKTENTKEDLIKKDDDYRLIRLNPIYVSQI